MAASSFWTRAGGRPGFLGRFSTYLFGLATWVPAIVWINANVAEVTLINGPSMYPFLNDEFDRSLRRDWVLNYKLYAQDHLARGMIVTLKSPFDPDKIAVKRIVGLEGDVVRTRRPYPDAYATVPLGHVWVEGDSADARKTLDSNTYGPVSARLITGRVTHILLPWRKAGKVKWWEHRDRTGIARA